MRAKNDITRLIPARSIIPVVTIKSEETALDVLRKIADDGYKVVEITLRTPHGLPAIAAARKALPQLVIGAGTVMTARQYQNAEAAGAQFIVSPGSSQMLLSYGAISETPYIPGCMTTTEVMAAQQIGYTLVKLFPANTLGVDYMKHLGAVLPEMRFMPTGGIRKDDADMYLAAPNVHAVGGSWML